MLERNHHPSISAWSATNKHNCDQMKESDIDTVDRYRAEKMYIEHSLSYSSSRGLPINLRVNDWLHEIPAFGSQLLKRLAPYRIAQRRKEALLDADHPLRCSDTMTL